MKQTSEQTGVAQAVGQPVLKKRKRKKKVLIAVIIAIVLIAAVLLLKVFGGTREVPLLDLSDTTVLHYTDMEDSVSATGIVESARSVLVYSTMAYTVKEVGVEVGDYVEAGQLLAQLDDQMIQDQITSQELSMAASNRNSSQQVKNAQANYDNFKYNLENGLNASLISAQKQVDSTLDAYEKAQLNCVRYMEGLGQGENTVILNAESTLRAARNNLDSAQDALESAEESYDEAQDAERDAEDVWDDAEDALAELEEELADTEDFLYELEEQLETLLEIPLGDRTEEQTREISQLRGEIADAEVEITELEQQILIQEFTVSSAKTAYNNASTAVKNAEKMVDNAQRTLDSAQDAYESQQSSYNASLTGVDNTLADYIKAIETTEKAYQDALVSLESAKKSAQDQLQTYANSLASAKAGANNDLSQESLRQLRADLESTQITAPEAGTVTAVYAKVGAAGSGLLFVIEDVDHLVVETSVKGYDIGTVQTGMKVRVRSDATGEREIAGVISSIAPTSKKTSFGTTDTTGEAIFAAEVEVTEQNSGLRIGMEAQLDYIIEEQSAVLAVPYDAVYSNESGQSCLMAAEPQEDGKYLIRELEVTTGMDNDLDMVISGTEITEGLRVIHEPDRYFDLLGQSVTAGTGLRAGDMMALLGGA